MPRTLGIDINSAEIVDNIIQEVDLQVTNIGGPGLDGYALTYDDATGGFTWIDSTTPGFGAATDVDITDGVTTQNVTDGETITYSDGTNIDSVLGGTNELTVNVNRQPNLRRARNAKWRRNIRRRRYAHYWLATV